jgi:hypothetical protein
MLLLLTKITSSPVVVPVPGLALVARAAGTLSLVERSPSTLVLVPR